MAHFGRATTPYGGAIYNQGILQADGVTFTSNQALLGATAFSGNYDSVGLTTEAGSAEAGGVGGEARGAPPAPSAPVPSAPRPGLRGGGAVAAGAAEAGGPRLAQALPARPLVDPVYTKVARTSARRFLH